ncbi:MAG: hypothetical protein PGN13_02505 [Patulibacter minatonensis]
MPRRLEQAGIVLVLVVGAVLMWTAVPALWLWLAGRFSRVSQSDMSSLAIVIVGMPSTMIAVGAALGRLDRRYMVRFGPTDTHVVGARWMRSLRGGHEDEPVTLFDKIMIVNIALALLTLATWFVLFSHGSQAPRI